VEAFRRLTESLARKTTRRNLLGHGAGVATGALMGVAAGSYGQDVAMASHHGSQCTMPGPPCPCEGCQQSGVCGKPCTFAMWYYASGCYVWNGITCCDCACPGVPNQYNLCGCSSDWHNNPANCPASAKKK
jgi:hypothetical protein